MLRPMDETPTTDEPNGADAPAATDEATSPVIDDELLLEEVSIDGMCGVY